MSSEFGPLARRAVAEHRYLVILLVVLLGVNVLGYAFYIYPLADRVNSVTERTRDAEAQLAGARAEHARAAATLNGSAQAATELDEFYGSILPRSFAAARQLFYPKLANMARRSNVAVRTAQATPTIDPDEALAQVKISVQLQGPYPGIRRFIHDLERAPEFIAIDHIALSEQGDDGQLAVDMDVSTYYRAVKP